MVPARPNLLGRLGLIVFQVEAGCNRQKYMGESAQSLVISTLRGIQNLWILTP